ncbi:MAG TPA: hypothetical protein VJ279_07440 [Hanamia sp.]|nr:hypothetical protein [Hanamia sp.]
MITEKLIIDAYVFLRRTNNSIPDEVLDFIKESSLSALRKQNALQAEESLEKPKATLSVNEIKDTAKMLWEKPIKLEAVKLVMKLGYSLKDAKAYCELHFD